MSAQASFKTVTTSCGVTTHDMTGAARAHGIGKTNLYQAIQAGELPARKRVGKYLVRCIDIERWIDATTEPSAAEIGRVA